MALTKCKECGEQVSTKAETCPKCGAKRKKKTSLFTWLVLIVIVLVAIGTISKPSSTTGVSSASADSAGGSTKAPELPRWEVTTEVDKMTGKQQVFASSPEVSSTKPMESPYTNVYSWLGFGCDAKSEWAYFGFSKAPNLVKTETSNGFSTVRTRVKWDSTISNENLTQKWGASFLHFANYGPAIGKLLTAKEVLLELDWYSQNRTYFQYSLNGAADAIKAAREKCHKAK